MGKEATVTAVVPVAMSVFAISSRAGKNFQSAYISGLELLTGVVWPVFMFLGLMAVPIIRIMFGSQWDASAPPAHLLAIAGGIAALTALHYPAYQAVGALRQRVTVQLVAAPVQIVSVLVMAHFGLVAAAGAFVLSTAVEFTVSQRVINRLIGASFREIAWAVRKSMYVAILTAAGPAIILIAAPPAEGFMWQPLLGATAIATVAWLAAIFALGHPLSRELRGVVSYGRSLLAQFAPLG